MPVDQQSPSSPTAAQRAAFAPFAPSGDWDVHVDQVRGIDAVSWCAGSGPSLILIHGVGPGTCGIANFEPLLPALTAEFRVHLIDLIGFGASGRKPAAPYFDMALWVEQVETVIARNGEPVALIGNSVGGSVAFKAAARDAVRRSETPGAPDIRAAMSIGSPLCGGAPPPALLQFWQAPDDVAALGRAMAPMSAAKMPPPIERVTARFSIFASQPDYATYFSEMVAQPEVVLAAAAVRDDERDAIRCPLTVVHGLLDAACLYRESGLPFIAQRAATDAVLFGRCGHNVTWERTADLHAVIQRFLLQH